MELNLLDGKQLAALRQLFQDAVRVAICCHKSPDGDALGSSLALAEYLKEEGKQPVVCVPDAFPDFLHWLPGTETIIRYDKHPDRVEEVFRKADLVCCLDFNVPSRLEGMQPVLQMTEAPVLQIDHHIAPDMKTALTVSFPEMSSTCELVFRLLWQLGAFERMSRKCATDLYCGMMTDTGGFTYNSCRPEIFLIISKLLSKGIDKDKIYRKVFNNYSQYAIRLRGYLMNEKLQVLPGGKASFFSVTRDELKRFHFIKGDLEGLVNVPLRIKGMKVSVSLREDTERDNLIWVSLRSVDEFPCNKLAEQWFNGGGHLNASGGRLQCSMREALEITREALSSIK